MGTVSVNKNKEAYRQTLDRDEEVKRLLTNYTKLIGNQDDFLNLNRVCICIAPENIQLYIETLLFSKTFELKDLQNFYENYYSFKNLLDFKKRTSPDYMFNEYKRKMSSNAIYRNEEIQRFKNSRLFEIKEEMKEFFKEIENNPKIKEKKPELINPEQLSITVSESSQQKQITSNKDKKKKKKNNSNKSVNTKEVKIEKSTKIFKKGAGNFEVHDKDLKRFAFQLENGDIYKKLFNTFELFYKTIESYKNSDAKVLSAEKDSKIYYIGNIPGIYTVLYNYGISTFFNEVCRRVFNKKKEGKVPVKQYICNDLFGNKIRVDNYTNNKFNPYVYKNGKEIIIKTVDEKFPLIIPDNCLEEYNNLVKSAENIEHVTISYRKSDASIWFYIFYR